jgi:hypothetical protein
MHNKSPVLSSLNQMSNVGQLENLTTDRGQFNNEEIISTVIGVFIYRHLFVLCALDSGSGPKSTRAPIYHSHHKVVITPCICVSPLPQQQ